MQPPLQTDIYINYLAEIFLRLPMENIRRTFNYWDDFSQEIVKKLCHCLKKYEKKAKKLYLCMFAQIGNQDKSY